MKPRWELALALFALLALVAMSVVIIENAGRQRVQLTRIEVWYTDPARQFLVPTVRRVSPRYIARRPIAAVGLGLLDAPPPGLASPLPAGARVRFVERRGKEAVVELQASEPQGAGSERLAAGAIVRTALGSPSVRSVALRLVDGEGQPQGARHLDLTAAFDARSPELFNTWEGTADAGVETRVVAWFRLAGTRFLVPLELASPRPEEPLRGTLDALATGPPRAVRGLVPAVPAAAKLRLVEGTGGGPLKVEWSRPDVPADPADQRLMVAATVLALTELAPGRDVQFITPAGALARRLGGWDLARPVGRQQARAALEIHGARVPS